MSNPTSSPPVNIRVPLNTHPSHFGTYGGTDDPNNSYYYSAIDGSLSASPARSFIDRVENFAGSYSRTSALYMAENLSVRGTNSNPPTIHGAELPEDEESLHENVKAK
jgi:hypothetical protein